MTISLISLDALWQDARQLNLPPLLAPWLLEPASLTARFKRHCQQFRVQVLNEQRSELPAFLRQLLPDTAAAQLREVILWCNDMPCVYAQSWLPQQTVTALRPLADLGERPLGDYIFQQPGLQRGIIEATQLDIALPLLSIAERCYARRSVFTLNGLPLLVAEAFLPAVALLGKTR
ncbi:chorismate--pyruvate lyase family protein [Rheinheimera maricola]|uniref:Probable chorismate pyruvate-lyase n=1 Tax=Rheinheimera maricola TaxID=2793282 RepID=A0ABS7X7V4_9GAMM|nr:chorismate lyase [Rheinheimera maricola]